MKKNQFYLKYLERVRAMSMCRGMSIMFLFVSYDIN